MTGGSIASRLPALEDVPQWNELHFSRMRRTDDCSLTTTGHLISQSTTEIRAALNNFDTSDILLLDDTSFSGNTNLLAKKVIKKAFPDRKITINHGFLIVNEGNLAPKVPGAIGRLGLALAGHRMRTPHDDGWHIFDIVQQPDLERHMENLQRALHHSEHEKALFTGSISTDALIKLQVEERFVTTRKEINGEWHIKNPQPLPQIIAAGHVEPIENWPNENEVFDTLLRMGKIINGEV